MAKKRVGILTGGGDFVPGLNIAIKSVLLNSLDGDYEIVGIRRGWLGLLGYDINNRSTHDLYIRDLNSTVVRRVDRTGGTLHTSRTTSKVRAKGDTLSFAGKQGARW